MRRPAISSPTPIARRTRGALLAFAALLIALLAPATASAALPVTFDGLSAGTTVSTQFAADGVTFLEPPAPHDLPYVQDVGTKANSGTKVAEPGCGGCEFDDRQMLIQLSTLSQSASVRIGIDSTSAVTRPVRLTALGASQSVIDVVDQNVSSANFKTLLTVNQAPSNPIAFLKIESFDGFVFGIDDVNFTPASVVTPDFAVQPHGPVTLRQGGSVTLPVDVLRFNGSSGNVALSSLGLGGGVTATFSPSTIGGGATATSTMTITAASNAEVGTTTSATVRGTPASGAVGPATRNGSFTMTVERPFTLAIPGEATAAVTPCSSTRQTLSIGRARTGFPGVITLSATDVDGYHVEFDQTTLNATGDGTNGHVVGISVSTTTPDPPATADIVVRASSPGFVERTAVLRVTRSDGRIESFDPTSGFAPRGLGAGGTLITVRGEGFCPGATVEFGTPRATSPAIDVAADGRSLTVAVPRLAATSAPLTVVTAGRRLVSADPFTAISGRTRQGFKFVNYTHPGVDLDVLTDLYGATQTQISFDPCNPLPGVIPPICPIPTGIPNPLVGVYIGISNAALGNNASCFGISVTSEHLMERAVPISNFTPAGAVFPADLDGFSSAELDAHRSPVRGPGPSLAREIRTWHTAQLSSSYLGYWIDNAAANVSNGNRGTRTTVENELRAGRHPLVALRFGTQGHAMVVTGIRPGAGSQDYFLDVYDPNLPTDRTDRTDPEAHATSEENSVIVVRGNVWTFRGAFSRELWQGTSEHMVVSPLSVMGRHPVMPTDPFGVVTLLVPLASGASKVSQVEDASGKKLLGPDGALNPDAAARPKGDITPTLTGVDSQPMYTLAGGGTSKLTLTGDAVGTGGAAAMGAGFAADVSGLKTAKGTTDQLELTGKSGEVGIDAALGGDVHARLARQLKNGDQLGADATIGGGDKGGHDLTLDARLGLQYENDGSGPATLRATLTWAGKKGTPGETTLPALTVPAGGSIVAVPKAWGKLGESAVAITVKDRRGKAIRKLSFKPKATKRVAVSGLTVKPSKGAARKASMRVTFKGVPKRATVKVAVYVRQGKKLVVTKEETILVGKAKGTKTYAFDLQLPKGSSTVYGTATVVAGAKVDVGRAKKTVRVS